MNFTKAISLPQTLRTDKNAFLASNFLNALTSEGDGCADLQKKIKEQREKVDAADKARWLRMNHT